jgi:ubiquinone/menaquinone biosynthesis C-methylase UbiE
VQREFSELEPELMDLPHQDKDALQKDLEHLAGLNRTFGARRTVSLLFHQLAAQLRRVVVVDLASGYGDHGRNLIAQGGARNQDVTVLALDCHLKTLQIAREATAPGQKMFFVQADARQLPLRTKETDLVFCSLALHHFSDEDALSVLREMTRVGRLGSACVDLVRSRLATVGIWLLTTFIVRDPMVRHDARLSIRRAFTAKEMKTLAQRAGWPSLRQIKFFWFQQAVLGRKHSTAGSS